MQTNDSYSTIVIETPANTSAPALQQMLRQQAGQRVILVLTSAQRRAQSGLSSRWRVETRDSGPSSELGLVHFQALRRQADQSGMEVAVVTRNSHLRQQAAEAGLPAFGSIEGAQSHNWTAGKSQLGAVPPPPPRSKHESAVDVRSGRLPSRFRRVRLADGDTKRLPAWLEAILLLVVLVLSIVAVTGLVAFIVPVATVTLVPAQEPRAETISVTARTDSEAPNYSDKTLPARRIGQRVEVEGTIPTTGSGTAPEGFAEGSVVFTNRNPVPQEIPPGTLVSTSTGSNVSFATQTPASVPGGRGAQVTVPIRAVEPGPAGNVRAFSINTVEGSLAVSLNVINPSATGGGTVKEVAVVEQADKEKLRAELEQQAKQKAYLALGELLNEGEFVPPETVGTLVVDETYDRFTDEAADELTLRLRLLATALAVDGGAADEMAARALGEAIPRRSQLLADSITTSYGSTSLIEDGDALAIPFDVTASGVVVLDVDPAAVRASIRGMSPAEAVAVLQEKWRLQSSPELSLGPDWLLPVLQRFDFEWLPIRVFDRVPWLPFRTHVNVRFQG